MEFVDFVRLALVYLVVFVVRAGWGLVVVGRGGVVVRWEVVGRTGCEVICTYLWGDSNSYVLIIVRYFWRVLEDCFMDFY